MASTKPIKSKSNLTDIVTQAEQNRKINQNSLSYVGVNKDQDLVPASFRSAIAKKTPVKDTIFLTYPQMDEMFTPNYIRIVSNSSLRGTSAGGDNDDLNYESLKEYDVDIALPLPDTFQNTQSVSYNQEKIFSVASAMYGDAVDDKFKAELKRARELVFNDFERASALRLGVAMNPIEEKLFDTVQFRNHNFDFEFHPSTESEAREVNRIIYWLKMGMLPNFGQAKKSALFNTPNTWDIGIYGKSQAVLEGFERCVLTNVTVNYGGGQKFAIFRDGNPVKTTMSLQFSETRIITQGNYHSKIASPVARAIANERLSQIKSTEEDDAPKPGVRGGMSGNLPYGAG